MKKRGFTLIELLATVLILAVIALITIPIVMNILDDVQKSKFKQNAKSLLNLVKLERDNKNMIGDDEAAVYNIDSSYGNVFFNDELIDEEFSGEIDGSGIIVVNKDGDMAISYSNGKWCAYKDYSDTNVKITKGNCEISSKLSCDDLGLEIIPENRWSQYKTLNVNSNSQTCKNAKYKINDGELTDLTENLVIVDNNTKLDVYTTSKYDVENEQNFVIDKIDRTPPESVVVSAISGTNLIELNILATDNQSGISAYSFSKDGGITWSNYLNDSQIILVGLTPGTYNIKAKAYNGTYGSVGATEELGATESDVAIVVVHECPTPVVTMNPLFDEYGQAKVISIDYGNNNNCAGSYSIDDGQTWNEGNKFVLYQPGTKVIAKNIEKKTNEVNTITYDIDTIDRTAPTEVNVSYRSSSPRTLTVVASATDPESEIFGYKFSKDGGQTYSNLQTSPVYQFTDLLEESYNIKVKAYNKAWFNTKDLVLDNGEKVENEELGSTESEITFMKPAECPAPTINVNPSGDVWASSKIVTISYDSTAECPVKKYSLNGGDWITVDTNSKTITLTENSHVAAYQGVTDTRGTNYQKYIDKIDSVTPTSSYNITTGTNYYYSSILRMNLGCNAGASGITKFTVTVSGSARNTNVSSSSVTYTTTNAGGKEVTTSTASGTDSFYPRSYRSTSGYINISVTCTNGAGVTSPAQTTSVYYNRPTDTPTDTPTPTPTPSAEDNLRSCCSTQCSRTNQYYSCMNDCTSGNYKHVYPECYGSGSSSNPYSGGGSGGGDSGGGSSNCEFVAISGSEYRLNDCYYSCSSYVSCSGTDSYGNTITHNCGLDSVSTTPNGECGNSLSCYYSGHVQVCH